MNRAALKERLNELEERYQEWVGPINQVIRECSYKVNRDGYTMADFDRDVKRVKDAQLATYDPYQEMYDFFDELCPAYLDAASPQRAEIRAAVSDKAGLLSALLGYVYRSASRIQPPSDGEWLRRGLAAASIENCAKDFRDVLLALAELYVAAEEAGIDPKPAFKAVARLSSGDKPSGGTTPVGQMLANFHRYGALKERKRKQKSASGR
jgi:hypothetical protein